MPQSLELLSVDEGSVLAHQGADADRFFMLRGGEITGKLCAESGRKNDEAVRAGHSAETWAEPSIIIGAESVLVGHYIESLVATKPSEVLVIPAGKKEILAQFAAAPKVALSFGRSLARKVMQANKNLSSSQASATKLEGELARYYTDFYNIVKSIAADADGDDLVLDALKDAKGSKSYSTGQRLLDDVEESSVAMTRVIESYEMQGKQHKLKKGEALCRAGDPGNSMFIVMKGKLSVVINGDRVGEINTGETVGEISVLLGHSDQKRTADLIADENTVVGIIPGDQFDKLAMVQPAMLLNILATLARRIEANYAVVSDREAREKKGVTRFLGKPDVDVEADYRALAKKLEGLIEEYELPLYRELDQLERGIERITTAKERFAHWINGGGA